MQIHELPSQSTTAETDQYPLDTGSTTRKISFADLKGAILSGDLTLSGNLNVGGSSDTVNRNVTAQNSLGNVSLSVSADGTHGVYSGTKAGYLVYATAGSANSALYVPRPLNITGLANVSNNVIATTGDTGERYFRAVNSNGSIELVASTASKGVYDRSGSRWLIYVETASTSNSVAHISYPLAVDSGIVGYYGTGKPVVSNETDTARVALLAAPGGTTFQIGAQWGGSTYSTKNVTVSSSDVRLKENIKDAEVEALPIINQMRVREFDWKDGKHQKIGVVADELEEIDERMAVGGGYDEDGNMNVKSVDTFYLVGYLVKAVQELSDEVERLKRELGR